jgi:hypothetical protein
MATQIGMVNSIDTTWASGMSVTATNQENCPAKCATLRTKCKPAARVTNTFPPDRRMMGVIASAAMKLRNAIISGTGSSRDSSRAASVMLSVHTIHKLIQKAALPKLDMSMRAPFKTGLDPSLNAQSRAAR